MRPLKTLARTLSLTLCCSGLLLAPVIHAQSANELWFERSDLQLPRQTSVGVLENGLRFVLLPIPNSQHNIAVRVVMNAGLLQEQGGQEGSSMYAAAQTLGQFPSVAKAQLELNQTVLSLHANSVNQMDSALSELAIALVNDSPLNASELEKTVENIAIDGRLLAPALSYAQQQQIQRSFNALQNHLSQVNSAQAMGFKQRFYAPKNITLVVVGDFNKRQLEQRIAKQFGDWQRTAATIPNPVVIPSLHTQTQITTKQDVSFNALSSYLPERDSKQQRRETMLIQVANAALQNRLNQILQQEGLSASTQVEWMMDKAVWSSVTVTGVTQEQSDKIQQQVQAEIQRALANGFSKAEFELAVTTIRARLLAQTELSPADHIRNQADRLVNDIAQRKVYLAPSSELALFDLFMAHAYEGDLTPALKQSWSNPPILNIVPSAS
ncbi:M16 family metallopeptidase [Vibrio sp. RC586]|uniref:M16 family metallopeptidase n=1 Tax=Vibrio sp. RC586 TaxID=675815 RepID=UPI001C4E40D0|nr:insulinase family protein [Vibrio sp. RC586]